MKISGKSNHYFKPNSNINLSKNRIHNFWKRLGKLIKISNENIKKYEKILVYLDSSKNKSKIIVKVTKIEKNTLKC